MTPSPPPDRRAIGILGAYIEGWRRVLRAPALWAGLLIVSAIEAFMPTTSQLWPFGHGPLLGLAVDGVRNLPMLLFFGVVQFVDPATALVNLVQRWTITSGEAGLLSGHVALWWFLWGGVLDRLARARPVGSAAFFAACGVYLWRFLRLAIPLGLTYFALQRWLPRDTPTTLAVLILLSVALFIVAEFARVRAVVEDRRSMVGALIASGRFVRRHLLAALALFALNIATMAAVMALGASVVRLGMMVTAPSWLSALCWVVLLLLLILLGLWTHLAFAASEIAYFQGALAHSGYTAAPLPVWPDSPAAEAIENLTRLGQRSEGRGQHTL